MSVEAFTVDGKVTLNTEDFDSAISNLVRKLNELKDGLSNLGIHTQSFTNEIGVADKQFDDLKGSVTGVNDEITSMASGLGNALKETSTLNSDLNLARENISSLRNETSTLVYDFGQFNTELTNAVGMAQALTSEFSSMRYYVDMVKAESEGLLQLEKEKEALMHKNKMDALTNRQTLISEADERNRIQLMEVEKELQEEMIRRLEREAQTRMKLREETIEGYQMGLHYLEQQHQAETLLYDDIIKRYEAQGKLATTVQEQLGILAERNAQDESDIAFLEEQLVLQKEINSLVAQGGAENIKQAEALMKQLQTDTEVFTILEEEIALEKEKLALLEEQDAVLKKQTADREKQLVSSQKGNKLDKMGYLPSRIGSMALTMWGFNEIMDVYNNTYSHINAEGQRDYFAKRIGMDTKALSNFKGEIASMQKQYQKLDMTVVGANALETASKYGVESESLGDLTKVMAIYGSEFVKQGRSQEDSILAINDALDGELRRLKEVGIGKEELQATGLWNGDESDKNGMILALLQIADERGYTKTAQEITNLSDAIQVLEVRLAIDLAQAFHIVEPILTETAKVFVGLLTLAEQLAKAINDLAKAFGKWLDGTFGKGTSTKVLDGLTKGLGYLLAFLIMYKVADKIREAVSGFELLGKGWGKLQDKLGKTKGMDKASDSLGDFTNSTTGGTKGTGGGFKENFKEQWGKLGKDLGVMARVFVDVAVALAMAFFLIEEGILIISGIGYTYESLKPQFEQGIQFIQEYGIWFALLGGALLGVSYLLKDIPTETMAQVGKGALNVAMGIGIAMGLVAVAIGSLLMPLGAIITLGALANWQQGNLDKGIEVLQMFADALNQITLPVGIFIGALLVASVILGYAPMLGVGLAIGIAVSIGLVAEAIFMLNAPLLAIASLGVVAQTLGQSNIQQGADALKIVGQALKTIADAVPSLLLVDFGVLGQELMDIGSKLLTGKDGLTYLSEEIIPNLSEFVESFNGVTINPIDTTTVANLSQVASQLPSIKSSIDTIRGSVGNGGTGGMNILGFQIGGDTSSLKPKLDTLYESIKDVMDFANKLGNLSTTTTGGVSSVKAVSSAVTQLQAKLRSMVNVINTASVQVKASAKGLGSGITQGFKTGSASFGSTVVSVLAKGVSEIQSRYNTFNNGGKTLGQKMIDGFKNHKPSLKTITSREISYALTELDNAKDDFYTKGKALGSELTRGYEDGADIHSPGLIARTTVRELRYTMDALDTGKKMMYQGGVALGQALTNGYNSYQNLRTDVGVLASKGVSNEQLQANARSVQANTKGKGQTQQSFNPTINIDMSNSTVIGVTDLNAKIQQAVEQAIVRMNTPNGAIGY